MIIRKPTREDLPRLSALWQEAFEESPEDAENYYETAFSPDRALLAEEQNPVACIYWMDAYISGQRIAYLYAFAVARLYRSKGIGKALLQKTLAALEKEGYSAAVLVPGEESLQAYYEKQGFSVFGHSWGPVKDSAVLNGREVPLDGYLAKRKGLQPAIEWGEESFAYLERISGLYAGEGWVLALGQEGVQEAVGCIPNGLLQQAEAMKPVAMACFFKKMTLLEAFGPIF